MPTPASRTANTVLGIGPNGRQRSSRPTKRSLLSFLHAKHLTRFGFWNLQRSIARDPGRQHELTARLAVCGVRICGLAGAWNWETGEHQIADGATILWTGSQPRPSGRGQGVGLLLGPSHRASLASWQPVSDRLLYARFRGTINLSIVVAYAPQAADAAGRAKFFTQLQRLLERIPGLDFQLVLGDFNSRVGSAAPAQWQQHGGTAPGQPHGSGALGRHGFGVRNPAGQELIHFCERSSLCVANTFFQHSAAHKATWRDPHSNSDPSPTAGLGCIDYALVKRQWLSSVRDVRVHRGADLLGSFSDHRLLVCSVRLKLRPPAHQPRPPRPCRGALAEERIQDAYMAAVEALPVDPDAGASAAERWASLSEGLVACARHILPVEPCATRPGQLPLSERSLALAAVRVRAEEALRAHGPGPLRGGIVLGLRRAERRYRRSRRRDANQQAAALAANLQRMAQNGNSHGFYAGVKAAIGQRAGGALQLRGPGGAELPPPAQAATFAAHFEAVHRDGAAVDAAVLQAANVPPNSEPWPLPTPADTGDAVRRLKSWRAADPAGVWAELLRVACRSAAVGQRLHAIVLLCLSVGMPPVVKQSELLPFFKKGDAADCNNYRGIQLISLLRKVLALILAKDLCTRLEAGLLEWQCGFRQQRSCGDQIFVLRKLSDLALGAQQRVYVAFVDLRKAFDSISRPALWVILRRRGVPEELISILADLHRDTTCRVRVGGHRSGEFGMEFGVQQGCPLASVLFNVFFDHVVREALDACPGSGVSFRRRRDMGADLRQPDNRARARGPPLDEVTVPVLMLADDLAVLAPTAEALQLFMTAFQAACRRWGLVISAAKTKLMLVGGAAATACEGCGGQHEERSMLLCDSCERGWHTACLSPPLASVPTGVWRCPSCALRGLDWPALGAATTMRSPAQRGGPSWRDVAAGTAAREADPAAAAAGAGGGGGSSSSMRDAATGTALRVVAANTAAREADPTTAAREADPTAAAAVVGGDDNSVTSGSSGGTAWQPLIEVSGRPLEWVDSFKYLGALFHETGSLEAELGRRVGLAAGCFKRLAKPIFLQKCISLSTRVAVYVCMIISVLLYGSESWAITDAQLSRLSVFHHDCLRKLLGKRRSDRMPIADILSRCRTLSFRDMLHRRQLQWLGHLGRMPDSRLSKQVLYSTMQDGDHPRRRGRPGHTLCDAYTVLVSEHFSRQRIRAHHPPLGPGTTWHTIAQTRVQFKSFFPRTAPLSL
jgi:hypothetical protein